MNDLEWNDVDWLKPWAVIKDPQSRLAHERESSKEVGPQHILHGRPATAIARRFDQDDVLFVVERPREFAVVHLVWSGKQDRSPWPDTTLFDTLASFVENQMKPDHRAITGESGS